MMKGPSREAHKALAARVDDALGGTGDGAAQRATSIGDALFTVAALLWAEPAVRRALIDPGRSPDGRATLARRLFGDRVEPAAADLVIEAVRDRWDGPRDLISAIDEFGVVAHLAAAEANGRLDSVEDELFRFGQVVHAAPELRAALLDQAAPEQARRELVRRLLADRASPGTVSLIEHAVLTSRDRRLEPAIDRIIELAAGRRQRRVAVVRVASALTQEHRDRLENALAEQAGGPVRLNVVVDPDLVGGVKVEIGDEVVDGTVQNRIAELQRRLAEQ
jgi:F-type H+-transporting ATPase subunit delta